MVLSASPPLAEDAAGEPAAVRSLPASQAAGRCCRPGSVPAWRRRMPWRCARHQWRCCRLQREGAVREGAVGDNGSLPSEPESTRQCMQPAAAVGSGSINASTWKRPQAGRQQCCSKSADYLGTSPGPVSPAKEMSTQPPLTDDTPTMSMPPPAQFMVKKSLRSCRPHGKLQPPLSPRLPGLLLPLGEPLMRPASCTAAAPGLLHCMPACRRLPHARTCSAEPHSTEASRPRSDRRPVASSCSWNCTADREGRQARLV